jgi:hypothetical protein
MFDLVLKKKEWTIAFAFFSKCHKILQQRGIIKSIDLQILLKLVFSMLREVHARSVQIANDQGRGLACASNCIGMCIRKVPSSTMELLCY